MLPGRKFTLDQVGAILWRRRWLVVLPFAAGLVAAPLIASRVPELYRSETLIMVIPQRVPDSYVRSTVTATLEDRLPSISDQILSRSRLERIIEDFNLYPRERANAAMEDVVRRMRGDILVTPPVKEQQSFRVAYVSRDAVTAQKVTARLASLYIEENLRDRANLAESTNVFLESQLEDAKQRLLENEKKLEEYRRRYSGQLPSQLQGNLQAIQSAQMQLQAVSEAMNRARERRHLVERQVADVESMPQSGVLAGAGSDGSAQLTAAQQLEVAQANLKAFRLRYTPDHPDVRALERTIKELQVRAAEEASRPAPSPTDAGVSPAEVARQRRIRDLRAELELIDRQLSANESEAKRLKEAIADYHAKVDVVPQRESELVELTRDYSTLQAAYQSLVAKHEDAKLAADLERRQIGEQFRILDPASLPEKPYNQLQRLGFIGSGAMAGIVLGLLFVGLLEYRDSSFKREEDVFRALSLPVLALVPAMIPEDEQRIQRRRALALNLAGVLALIGSAAVLVIWGVQP